MHEKIHIVLMSPNITNIVKSAINTLNESQKYFQFYLVKNQIKLPPKDLKDSYSWKLLTSLLKKEKEKLQAKYLFGILDQRIENNWFSSTIYENNIAFITTCDWEFISKIQVVPYIAYEIVENLLQMLIGKMVFHNDTRGCINDMCALKTDISFKIRTADICNECLDIVNQKLKTEEIKVIVKMLENIRLLALNRKPIVVKEGNETIDEIIDKKFPFPVSYCFRSMQNEINYSRKWLKLLELFEIILKYQFYVLLSDLKQNNVDIKNLKEINNLKRPSLGHIHSLFFKLLTFVKKPNSGYFTQEWIKTFNDKQVRNVCKVSSHMIELRNNTLRGHGFVESDDRYQELFHENIKNIIVLINFMFPLAINYLLINIENGLKHRRGIFEFKASVMQGSNPLFRIMDFKTKEIIENGCYVFNKSTNKFLCIRPWLVVANCPECKRDMVFFYDRIDNEKIVMRDYPTNHNQKYNEKLYKEISIIISKE